MQLAQHARAQRVFGFDDVGVGHGTDPEALGHVMGAERRGSCVVRRAAPIVSLHRRQALGDARPIGRDRLSESGIGRGGGERAAHAGSLDRLETDAGLSASHQA